jgi:hypothetical protein
MARDPIEELLADLAREKRADFAFGFMLNQKGSLWRRWEGLMLSVFASDIGGYAWCVSDSEGRRRFSGRSYQTKQAAIGALWDELRED